MLCTSGFVDGVIFAHNRPGIIGNSTISIECIRVPINCSSYNYVPVCLAPFLTDFNLHYLYLAPSFGVIPLEFGRDLCRCKNKDPAIVWRSLHYDIFSCFGRTQACDGQMHGQTDGQTAQGSSMYRTSVASRGKILLP